MFDGPARKHFSSYVSIAFELIHSKKVTYFLMKRFKYQVLALSFFKIVGMFFEIFCSEYSASFDYPYCAFE